jgi:NADH-quinone oxidoreductase subunit J
MTVPFAILAAMTLLSAIAAVSMKNLVHCALCLVATFGGLAGLYLTLEAEFVGLVQVLVYVGAVAILIVFAILLTRGDDGKGGRPASRSWISGLVVAGLVAGSLVAAVVADQAGAKQAPASAVVTVKRVGTELMTDYIVPLEVIGLLLTAALIGAVLIAMRPRGEK